MTPLTFEQVQQLHQEGNIAAAREGYLNLLTANPEDAKVLHMLGILSAEEGDSQTSLKYLERALNADQNDPTLYLHLANIQKANGYLESAAVTLVKLLEHYPQFASGYNNLGTIYYSQGKYKEAEAAFRHAINLQADYVDAYYNLGLALNKSHHTAEAINTYRSVLELAPQHPGAHFQLGCMLMQQDKIEAARDQFEIVSKAYPNHLETQANLATCYLKLGDIKKARLSYMQALALAPDDMQILFNLGVITAQESRWEEAIKYYTRCLELNPEHFAAHNNLGVVYQNLKKPELAVQHFRAALRLHPEDAAIKHAISILNKDENISSSPVAYVRNLFDSYADHYDHHLSQSLQYRVPQVFQQILAKHNVSTAAMDIADLGCGTGLTAEIISKKQSLIGIDVSEKMLAKAREKNIYNELIAEDISTYLKSKTNKFDLILAGDVLVYYGELENILKDISLALKKGGYFLFSTESTDSRDYLMTESGRFAHSKQYIQKLLAVNQLKVVEQQKTAIRYQNGIEVTGYVYLTQK